LRLLDIKIYFPAYLIVTRAMTSFILLVEIRKLLFHAVNKRLPVVPFSAGAVPNQGVFCLLHESTLFIG